VGVTIKTRRKKGRNLYGRKAGGYDSPRGSKSFLGGGGHAKLKQTEKTAIHEASIRKEERALATGVAGVAEKRVLSS